MPRATGETAHSGTATSADRAEEPVADVGIVIVHGIGNQRNAETLLRYAEPLFAYASSRCRALGGSGGTVDHSALEETALPAHTRWTLGMPDGRTMSWLVAEARWADCFRSADEGSALFWAAAFSKRAVTRVAAHLLRPIGAFAARSGRVVASARATVDTEASEPRSGGSAVTAGYASFLLAIYLLMAILLFVVYVWIPLVAYAATLVALAALIVPAAWVAAVLLTAARFVPLVRGTARRLAASLASSVGDSYSFLEQPVQAAAMQGSILSSLTWAAARARRLIVIAHSQGSAIAVTVLFQDDPRLPRVDTLMTVGSAVSLLDRLEPNPVSAWRTHQPGLRWINVWSGWDPVSAGPIVDSGCSSGSRWNEIYDPGPEEGPPETAMPSSVPNPFLPPSSASSTVDESTGGGAVQADSRTGTAVRGVGEAVGAGIGAAYGSMAGAALSLIPTVEPHVEPAEAGPAEVVVHNRASLLRDHNTYAENDEQVIARIAAEAAASCGYGAEWSLASDTKAERDRVTAVRLLGATRLLNAFLGALIGALLVEGGHDESIAAAVETGFHWLGRDLGDAFDLVPAGFWTEALWACVLGAAAFVVSNAIAATTWTRWRKRAAARNADGSRTGLRPALPFAFVASATTAAVPALLIWLAARSGDEITAELLVVATVPIAIMLWSWGGIRPRTVDARFERVEPRPTPGS